MSAPTYVHHTPYGYYFRLRIPLDLKDIFGKTELRYSLRTNVMSDAKSKARLLAGRVQSLFKKVRSNVMSLNQNHIQNIVRQYVQESISEDNNLRIFEGPFPSEVMTEDNLNIEHVLETFKKELAQSNHVETVGKRVDKLLESQSLLCPSST